MILRALRGRMALRKADRCGQNVRVHGPVYIQNLGRIVIGDRVQLGGGSAPMHLVTAVGATLEIGAGASIAHGCGVSAHSQVSIGRGVHMGAFTLVMDSDFHTAADHDAVSVPMPIVIGDDCRIGAHVTILRGARIGDGAQVYARSVVTGDVPAGAIVRGVPARVVSANTTFSTEYVERELFDDRAIEKFVRELLATALRWPEVLGESATDVDVIWESLAALHVLLSLEEHFGIQMRPEQLSRLRSVHDVIEFVKAEQVVATR